ncbi:D-glucuronyl C5-epimerase family protein [Nitrospira sp. Nam74]
MSFALRALKQEIFGFRLDYPVEVIEKAGPSDCLHYYLWNPSLFLDNLDFDQKEVPRKRYRAQGAQYNPLFIAWWGLSNLQQYLKNHDKDYLKKFLIQVAWLKANAVHRVDGAVVWPCYFDWQEGFCKLDSPWISAMYQGVVISTLVRGYRINGDRELLDLCKRAVIVFSQDIEKGGVRTFEGGRALYEEYPAYPLPRVLDGFLFSLLGLYDLAIETGSADIRRLFEDGIDGLKGTLEFWNYRNKWSWYGSHGYLCPPHYHKLNGILLLILGRLTGDTTVEHFATLWDTKQRTFIDKVEIFLMFAFTKNRARLGLPRN